ncbi:MAG: N-acetyltransferase [Deltaproteobacteria bacterium]|nr:N-acetyltransferase [Deltaproteobacteria bacterium]
MTITIIPVESRQDLQRFIRLPYSIYANDPHWVAPLEFERKQFFDRKKNPFFHHGDAELFLALKNGKPVGRISAQMHKTHLERFQDAAGFFGFFESIDDAEVAEALVNAAEGWLKKKGLQKIRGPFNFLMYDNETGILIDGFETPPYIMMNHNPLYYASLLEKIGFAKVKDLYSFSYKVGELSEQVLQLAEATAAYPGLTLRSVNMKNFDEDIRLMLQIFNEAWEKNWGFVPATEDEMKYIAKMLKPIIDPSMAFFALVNGEPAAFSIALPNINEAIKDLNGKLFPFGFLKLLWRIKKRGGIKSARLCLMGIRKPYRGSALGALSVLMNVESHRRGLKRGLTSGECGWTLEDNDRINKGIEFMGGKRYKTYRIYEKSI